MAERPAEKKTGWFRGLFGGRAAEPQKEDEVPAAAPTAPLQEKVTPEPTAPETVRPERVVRERVVRERVTSIVAHPAPAPAAPVAAPVAEPAGQTPAPRSAGGTPAPQVQPEPAPAKVGFFARLKQQLSKTKSTLVERVRQAITLHGKMDEEMLEEIETILLQADVGIETTTKILDRMRKSADARKSSTSEELIASFKDAIRDIVSHDERTLQLQPSGPTVMLIVGVNGTGKTTTIGKLAREYANAGKKVMLVAADTFRAAAIDQLAIWADRTKAEIVQPKMGTDPASVCYDALSRPDLRDFDVILIDTAGRLHTKTNLMEELKKVERVIKKVIPEAPHETILVLDATTGQNALSQAKIFGEAVRMTGMIMTKLDGTAKGGILVALRDLFDVPVLKIGIGEGEHDLRDFDPGQFVDALFET